jgi:hypothetical protein
MPIAKLPKRFPPSPYTYDSREPMIKESEAKWKGKCVKDAARK